MTSGQQAAYGAIAAGDSTTVLKERIIELSAEVTGMVADLDRMRQQLATCVRREAQIRQMLSCWSKNGSSGVSGDAAPS